MLAAPRATLRSASLAAALAVVAVLFPLAPAALAGPTNYVEMSDGVEIAINIRFPGGENACFGTDCPEAKSGKRFPVVFEMSGYDGGSADGRTPFNGAVGGDGSRGITAPYNKDYVTIHASVRGTGCSQGEFDLFSYRSALDGYELIEWINDQRWSNGKIAIYGHSYGGITGTMIAATQPPSLDAITTSGLIDDLYRGIVYPGGVSNYGFPLLWTGGIRNVYDIGGGTFDGLESGDQHCGENLATHGRTVLNDPIVQGLADTDNEWFRSRSLMSYIHKIEVPAHFTGAFQDEQTGPRGPYNLFDHLPTDIPRRLVITNGDHGTQTDGPNQADRKDWVDHWLGVDREPQKFGEWPAGNSQPHSSVLVRFDNLAEAPEGDDGYGYEFESTDFPLPETEWKDWYLHGGDMSISKAKPTDETSANYFSGSPRQGWNYQAGGEQGSPFTTEEGPDEVTFTSSEFEQPMAVAGPITATLFASSTAIDTEFFIQLIDEGPDGERYYLQRGMLKASHRKIAGRFSDRITSGDHKGEIYRPYRHHTNPQNIIPGQTYEYLVEVFPVGHIFRPGHKLIVKIHTPPAVDSFYAYVPKRPVGINTIYFGPDQPSRLMLPVLPLGNANIGPPPAPCSLEQVRCLP